MNSRRLSARVTLQSPPSAVDGEGEPSGAWTVVATVFADIRYQGGLATLKAGSDVSLSKVSIRLNFRTDVQPGWKVVYGSTAYMVDATLPDGGKRFLDLVCTVVR